MKPLIHQGELHDQTKEAFASLRELSETLEYKRVARWIECLAAQHQGHMTQCPPEKLVAAQIRLRHILALHAALTGGKTTGFVPD